MCVIGVRLHSENMPDSHIVLSLRCHHKAVDQWSYCPLTPDECYLPIHEHDCPKAPVVPMDKPSLRQSSSWEH